MSVFHERPAWQDHAACHNRGNTHFYLSIGQSARRALALCANCPVRVDCLEYGLHDQHGIWGGLTPNERQTERERRRINRVDPYRTTWAERGGTLDNEPTPTPYPTAGSVPLDILEQLDHGHDDDRDFDPFNDDPGLIGWNFGRRTS